MHVYKVTVGHNGEIKLPGNMLDLLALTSGDALELILDFDGKIVIHVAKRSSGPLADFFEDLILNDLHSNGYMGDILKAKLLELKVQLSTTLDRLSQEAMFWKQQGHAFLWREAPVYKNLGLDYLSDGNYEVVLAHRAERDLVQLPTHCLEKLGQVLLTLEKDPLSNKRLRGPYYETYRVHLNGDGTGHFRLIYTVFPNLGFVAVLCIGDRKEIYDNLKGLISAGAAR